MIHGLGRLLEMLREDWLRNFHIFENIASIFYYYLLLLKFVTTIQFSKFLNDNANHSSYVTWEIALEMYKRDGDCRSYDFDLICTRVESKSV